jgi:hypothetical protein
MLDQLERKINNKNNNNNNIKATRRLTTENYGQKRGDAARSRPTEKVNMIYVKDNLS